jgi:hypothetical protein
MAYKQRHDASRTLWVGVWARDEQHAVKIVNERRAMILAANKWGDEEWLAELMKS